MASRKEQGISHQETRAKESFKQRAGKTSRRVALASVLVGAAVLARNGISHAEEWTSVPVRDMNMPVSAQPPDRENQNPCEDPNAVWIAVYPPPCQRMTEQLKDLRSIQPNNFLPLNSTK